MVQSQTATERTCHKMEEVLVLVGDLSRFSNCFPLPRSTQDGLLDPLPRTVKEKALCSFVFFFVAVLVFPVSVDDRTEPKPPFCVWLVGLFFCLVFFASFVVFLHCTDGGAQEAPQGRTPRALLRVLGQVQGRRLQQGIPFCVAAVYRWWLAVCQVSRWCLAGAVGDSITHKVEVLRCLHLRVMSWQIVARLEHWILLCWLSGCGQLAHKKSARVRVRC